MAEPDDLLGKADALMARHRLGRPGSEPFAEIPVLHEVVELGAKRDDLPVLTEYVVPAPLDIKQTEALAASILASLLAELQPKIDALIEQRIKDALSPIVERLFAELRGDLHLIAHEILGDAIRAAEQQELDRRK